jgi:hypothetical protein
MFAVKMVKLFWIEEIGTLYLVVHVQDEMSLYYTEKTKVIVRKIRD